ncbi:MAG: hypothetical protein SFZ23_04695, partial [Planctomycetota bacterium]|nr:hypothetical protein [Planctomycetota bacterium]
KALVLLGEALHPIMDSSSPMHSDPEGNPLEWNPTWPFGHSPAEFIGKETAKNITEAIYSSQDVALRNAYGDVFGHQ